MSDFEFGSDSETEDLLSYNVYPAPHQLGAVAMFIGTVASLVFYYSFMNAVITDAVTQSMLIILPTTLSVLTVITYAMTRYTPPPPVPRKFWLSDQEHMVIQSCDNDHIETFMEFKELIANRKKIRERTHNGDVKICSECDLLQPDRAYHCSVCKCCVLRMDKHSRFFGNCLHFKNYKTSLLTLFYACCNYTYMAVTMVYASVKHLEIEAKMQKIELQVGLMLLAVLFCLTVASLSGLFLSMNLWHCMNNETFYEYQIPPSFMPNIGEARYDTGNWLKNLKQLIGPNVFWWFFPINDLTGDGTSFPVRIQGGVA